MFFIKLKSESVGFLFREKPKMHQQPFLSIVTILFYSKQWPKEGNEKYIKDISQNKHS